MPLVITREDDAPEADANVVSDGLDAFNLSHTGDAAFGRVRLFLRDERREVKGGLLAVTYFGWMFVAILWVDEWHRGEGHGQALLRRAEEEAAAAGCHSVWLDTFSFQAPDFYRGLGYEEFGRLDDYPAGHTRVFLRKRLSPPKPDGMHTTAAPHP